MKALGRVFDGLWRAVLVVAGGGTVLAASCTSEQVKAVLAGVEVVTQQLSQNEDDVSFNDWLSSELND